MSRHLIGALCLLSLCAAVPAFAQQSTDTCVPDCPASTWGSLEHRTVVLPNGCQINVDYFTRCACNTWNDIFLHSVTPDPADSADCAFLATTPMDQILAAVTEQLLNGSPFDFPAPCRDDLAVGQCATRWRIVKGSCWSRIHLSSTYEYYQACSQTACCLKPYKVCRNQCGRTSQPLPGTVFGGCSGAISPYPPPVGGACEPVCLE